MTDQYEVRYQWSAARARPQWTTGNVSFKPVWTHGWDHLRFHGGKGFFIRQRPLPKGAVTKLDEIEAPLHAALDHAPNDTIFAVRSMKDRYGVLFRKHRVKLGPAATKGELVIAHAEAVKGTPYSLGTYDCSWLTMHCYALEGVVLPHNAHQQRIDPQVIPISRAQIKPGDLLFIHDDAHVAIYLDAKVSLTRRIIRALVRRSATGTGRVWDTEPHDAPAPWGGWLHRGVQIRPMESGWYCGWENVNGIGRVEAINGKP